MKKTKKLLSLFIVLIFLLSTIGLGFVGKANSANFSFKISGPSEAVAGEPCNILISVLDLNKNVIKDATNAVGIVAQDISGLPEFFKFSKGNKGSINFTVKFTKAGISTIKVFDLRDPEIFAIYEVYVSPGEPDSLYIDPSVITVYSGEIVKFNIFSSDHFDNINRNPTLDEVDVETINGTASGSYLGKGMFSFRGEGECQIAAKTGSVISSANVFVVKSKNDFLFVNLSVLNNGFRENSAYEIEVNNGKSTIKAGSKVNLYFPVDALFPCPCHKKILNTEILIDGHPLKENPQVSCNGFWHILSFTMPVSVSSFRTFRIDILKSAGIMNPMRNDKMRVGLSVSEYSNIYYSNYAKIENLIDTPKMYVFPSITSQNAKFVFVFHTKKNFYLKKGSPLGIVFPYGSILPDFPNASNFSINGYSLWKGSVITKWNERTYTITTPFDITGNQTLIIRVSRKAGIVLPPYEGNYRGGIIYNFNILTVKSNYVYIKYKSMLDVFAKLPKPNSSINYLYNFDPEVSFDVISTYGYIKSTVMYSVDGSKFIKYVSPFLLKTDGEHVVKYYVVNTLGIKSGQKIFRVKIDTRPPKITFCYSQKMGNATKYVFKSNELLSSVYINGYYTVCNMKTKEFYIILNCKPQQFVVKATDLAGNVVTEKFSG